jgi:hypothetical protein
MRVPVMVSGFVKRAELHMCAASHQDALSHVTLQPR